MNRYRAPVKRSGYRRAGVRLHPGQDPLEYSRMVVRRSKKLAQERRVKSPMVPRGES